MIVKIVNDDFTKFVECISAVIRPDIQELGGAESEEETVSMVFLCRNGNDITYPLGIGDTVYYLNDSGKTIDRDFRMCCQKLKQNNAANRS